MEYPRKSYWHYTAEGIKIPIDKEVDLNKKFDILIIGAGITGLTTAYLLKDSGLKVGVIEATEIGYGVTGYTTAKITIQHDLIYDYLINSFSFEEAQQYKKANEEGVNLIKKIIEENNIQCDFKEQDAFLYAASEYEVRDLERELKAYEKLNIDGYYTETTPLPNKTYGAIGIRNQGQFNPLKYLYSLYNILQNHCEIYENARALNIEPHNDHIDVETERGTIHADKVITTSHYPFDDSFGLYFLRLYQDKSYVIAARTKEEPFEGMYININDPIYSMRYQFSDRENLLILAGGNHRSGEKDDENESYEELEKFLYENFEGAEIVAKWSTQDCMTYDKIPYIGRYSSSIENLYLATGFKKWGMSHSAAAALILRNKVLGIKDDYSEIFIPSRFTPLQSSKEFFSSVKSIAGGFLNRLSIAYDELPDVDIGEGKIIDYRGKKVGVYRNENGDYFCINPVCAHLKCALSFNEAEKTWDCPCHGSRYDIKGNILEGPAVHPLDRIKIKK
ncbi:MAG TPA: FAD-dependent oxidoreductase [Tissierellia bacterium]|jgi:glycine/D-amino acid oxidase-like deaminating enzyme/nitrite reductase/ring-hydroxylating ferredoxin subunit|nr:FAD-dependent oxidoreductase [Tissierellia bacterium]